eukprot:4397605-Amphidinium_carterae.1
MVKASEVLKPQVLPRATGTAIETKPCCHQKQRIYLSGKNHKQHDLNEERIAFEPPLTILKKGSRFPN